MDIQDQIRIRVLEDKNNYLRIKKDNSSGIKYGIKYVKYRNIINDNIDKINEIYIKYKLCGIGYEG